MALIQKKQITASDHILFSLCFLLSFCLLIFCFSLVKGAHSGEGLGNNFLSHIRAVDGLLQVVRVFDDPDVTHVEGNVDPIRDLEIIGHELRCKDLQLIENEVARLEKVVRQIDKTKKGELDMAVKLQEWVKSGKDVRDGDWPTADIPYINTLQLLTAKPSILLCNMTPDDYIRKKNKWLKKLLDWAKGTVLCVFSSFSFFLFALP